MSRVSPFLLEQAVLMVTGQTRLRRGDGDKIGASQLNDETTITRENTISRTKHLTIFLSPLPPSLGRSLRITTVITFMVFPLCSSRRLSCW